MKTDISLKKKSPVEHLSVSAITTYQTCPRQFHYQYVMKAIGLPSKALDIGKYVHRGIELIESQKDWLPELKKDILHKMNDENVEMFRLIRRILDAYKRNPVEGKTIGNELKCEFELENSKGEKIPIPFLGFIDRVIDRGIVEYKTTGENYTQEKIDKSIQATMYSYFFYKLYKEYPKDIIFWVVNKKEVMKKEDYLPQIMITCRTQQDVDDLFEEIKQIYASIIDEKFEPTKGDHCFWCGFRNLCRKNNY